MEGLGGNFVAFKGRAGLSHSRAHMETVVAVASRGFGMASTTASLRLYSGVCLPQIFGTSGRI